MAVPGAGVEGGDGAREIGGAWGDEADSGACAEQLGQLAASDRAPSDDRHQAASEIEGDHQRRVVGGSSRHGSERLDSDLHNPGSERRD